MLALLAIFACSTPREQCINLSNRPVAQLDRLISTALVNFSRGYALVEVQDVRILRASCEGTNENESTIRFPSEETETATRQASVAINVVEERTKLIELEKRRDQSVRKAQSNIQQCVAIHPE